MSLLNAFSELMTKEAVGQVGKAFSIDTAQTQKGLDVVGPLVLGSLARKSESVAGMDSIMKLLPDDQAGGMLGQLLGATGIGKAANTASALNGVFGPGLSTITKALTGRLGFDVSGLLSLAAPMLLGVLGKAAKEHKLNSVDLAKKLQGDSAAALASARPEVRAILDEAFQLSDRAEQLKSTFTDEEWTKIRLAPAAATFYIASASPSGLAGLSKEIVAAGEAMKAIVKNALPTSLIDVAFGSLEGGIDFGKAGLDEKVPRTSMLAALKAAAQTVKSRRPLDAESFRDTILSVSRKVAEATKEGGFLGIGGTLVSKEEELAIADISGAVA